MFEGYNNPKTLEFCVNTALESLKADKELFSFDAESSRIHNPERAIAHRLGCYLQLLFEDLKVDCEYNKHVNDPKRNGNGKIIVPDIVVHRRKVDTGNLLVIEVKTINKTTNDKSGIENDKNKLIELTRGIQTTQGLMKYDYGLFILFNSSKPSLQWFKNGKPIDLPL